MVSRWTMFAGAAALSVAAFGVSAAPGPGRGFGGHHRGGLMEDAKLLDLSDEQNAQLKDLYKQHHETVRPLMEREHELFRNLREAASQDGADPAAVGRIAIDAHKVGQQLRAERQKMEDAFVNLLTPEQKEMWSKMQASREKERERRREEWGHGRKGGADASPRGEVR